MVLEPTAGPPQSLADYAYESLREGILSGRVRMGQHLVEGQLAAELGTSRGPVREALRRLQRDRLVVERPRRGVFVRTLTSSDLADIYNLRVAIETAAVRLAVRRGATSDPLRAIIDAMRADAREDDLGSLVGHEVDFHQALCEISGNGLLASFYTGIGALVRLSLVFDDEVYPDLTIIPEEHVSIADAIDTGREENAVQAVYAHLVTTWGGGPPRGVDPGDLLDVPSSSDSDSQDGHGIVGG
jgi:GntR family transcriptional regulator of gluconate operon